METKLVVCSGDSIRELLMFTVTRNVARIAYKKLRKMGLRKDVAGDTAEEIAQSFEKWIEKQGE